MNMSYKVAADILRRDDVSVSARVEAIKVALEALDKLDRIAPVGNVYPDWYDRLSNLEYNHYYSEKDGEPWYRAKDVWACIEPVSEEHREFGGINGLD